MGQIQKVFIVNEGEWGDARHARGDYDAWVRTLESVLARSEKKAPGSSQVERRTDVEVVSRWRDGLAKAKPYVPNATLVFISRGMLSEAEQAKKEVPHLKVVLFTGLFPEDRVIVVPKSPALSLDMIRAIILDW